mgnify:CR=1 FL=1
MDHWHFDCGSACLVDLPQNKEEKEQGTVLNALQKGEIFAGLAAVVLIFAITAANILLPDKEFSEKENRMLAEKPEISVVMEAVPGRNSALNA